MTRGNFSINFMKIRRIALLLSAVLILGSISLLMFRGLNLGIDFKGGNLLQIELPEPTNVSEVRSAMSEAKAEQAVIQAYSDRGFIIRLKTDSDEEVNKVISVMKSKYPGMELLRLEKVGPVVGQALRKQALIAVCVALLGILAYITFRFRFRFAVVSVLALIHDSLITLGVFSLTGREISLPFIAAILTIVGYSLNDTIVVLDRIRENWKHVSKEGIINVLNMSINQTLSRTINTSLTTFLPVTALFIWGGPVIANFAFAIMVGIIVGTYSSIYIASALLAEWYKASPEKR